MGRYVAFSQDYKSQDRQVTLTPEESYHLAQVLRVRPGDSVQLVNGQGLVGQCTAKVVDPRKIELTVLQSALKGPLRPAIELVLGIPKPKALEQVLKQGTELGVEAIRLLHCDHTAYVLEPKEHQWERYKAIVTEACKQSLNPFLPKLYAPVKFKTYLDAIHQKINPVMVVASLEVEAAPLKAYTLGAPERVVCFVGPEGDFSAREYAALKGLGAYSLCLGTNILRVETAVVAMLGQVRGFL